MAQITMIELLFLGAGFVSTMLIVKCKDKLLVDHQIVIIAVNMLLSGVVITVSGLAAIVGALNIFAGSLLYAFAYKYSLFDGLVSLARTIQALTQESHHKPARSIPRSGRVKAFLLVMQILVILSIPSCALRMSMRMDLFGYESVVVSSDGPRIAGASTVNKITSPPWAVGALLCVTDIFDGTGYRSCFFRENGRYGKATEKYYSEHYPREACRAEGDAGCKRSISYVLDRDFDDYVVGLNRAGLRENFEQSIDMALFALALSSPVLFVAIRLFISR